MKTPEQYAYELDGMEAENTRLRAELADRIAINQDKDRELARLNADLEQWWEQFQEADKERMNLRAELAMAQDGLTKGEAARLQAGGMEMEIQQLRAELESMTRDRDERAKQKSEFFDHIEQLRAEIRCIVQTAAENEATFNRVRAQLATAREALQTLTGAVDPFLADQSGATSPHVGQVQPVSVAECCALNEAYKAALAALAAIQPKEVPGLRELMQFEAESATKNYEVGSQPKEGES